MITNSKIPKCVCDALVRAGSETELTQKQLDNTNFMIEYDFTMPNKEGEPVLTLYAIIGVDKEGKDNTSSFKVELDDIKKNLVGKVTYGDVSASVFIDNIGKLYYLPEDRLADYLKYYTSRVCYDGEVKYMVFDDDSAKGYVRNNFASIEGIDFDKVEMYGVRLPAENTPNKLHTFALPCFLSRKGEGKDCDTVRTLETVDVFFTSGKDKFGEDNLHKYWFGSKSETFVGERMKPFFKILDEDAVTREGIEVKFKDLKDQTAVYLLQNFDYDMSDTFADDFGNR